MKSTVTWALLAAGIALAIPAPAAGSEFTSTSARTSGSESVKGIVVISWGGESGG